jgi:hypothetical protein
MTRDCFEPGLAFLPLGSIVACCEGFAAPPAAADEAAERFFTDFDIKILRSVKAASHRTTEAPPRPSGRRGRISERPQRPELTTLPLQSRSNASPFWDHVIAQFTKRAGRSVRSNERHIREGTQFLPNLPADCKAHVSAQFLSDGRSPFGHAPLENGTGTEVNYLPEQK